MCDKEFCVPRMATGGTDRVSDPYLRGATRHSGTSIVVLPDRVTKIQSPGAATVELEKTRRAGEIGHSSGLFSVPAVLEADLAAGRIVTRTLQDVTGVETRLEAGVNLAPEMRKIGAALAAVHRLLVLPDAMKAPIPGFERDEGGPRAFLHGDYTLVNFFIDNSGSRLTIIDWQTASWLSGTGTWGPVAIDLAAMVLSLFSCRFHHRRRLANAPRLARLFLDAYFSASGIALDRDLFVRQTDTVLATFRGWWRRAGGPAEYLLHLPGLTMARHRLRSYSPPS